MLTTFQIAMTTIDLAGSLRFYNEAFGFRNAGGQGNWGNVIAPQDLPADSRAIMWWMVGSQDFFQLEFFQHSKPAVRPKSDDWRPSDCGWVRFGIATPDIARAIASLEKWGIPLTGESVAAGGLRRIGFVDPFACVAVEVRESARTGAGPSILYAASSVSDLEGARRFYEGAFQFPILDLEKLHRVEDEALWGLAGAAREGFVADAGNILIEVVRYSEPLGRPRPADYRASDQGIMNIGLGNHDVEAMEQAFQRLAAAGLEPAHVVRAPGLLAGYVNAAEREIELAALPEPFLPDIGFAARAPFLAEVLPE